MADFFLTGPIPSCRVDRDLLGEIEQYLAGLAVEYVDASAADTTTQHCEITLEEPPGRTARFRGVVELPPGPFHDSVKTISLRIKFVPNRSKLEKGNVKVTFDASRFKSQVEMSLEAPREKVLAMHMGLQRLLERYKTWHWVFQPKLFIAVPILVVAVYPAAVFMQRPPPQGWDRDYLLLIPLAAVAVYATASWLRPYSRLDTGLNNTKDVLFNWLWKALAGLISLAIGIIVVVWRKEVFGV